MKRVICLIFVFARILQAQTPTGFGGAMQQTTLLSQGSTGNGNPTTGCWDTGTVGLNPYYFCLTDKSLAGNAIIAGCEYSTTTGLGTPTLVDDQGQTYTSKIQQIHTGGFTVQIWVFPNSVAGAHQLKLSWTGTAPSSGLLCEARQWANVDSGAASCGTAVGANFSGTSGSAGSITPSQSGCLFYTVIGEDGGGGASYSPAAGWALKSTDVRIGFATSTFVATGSATTCSITLSTSDTGAAACIALKQATQGSVPSGPITNQISMYIASDSVTTYNYEFPCSGNHVVVTISDNPSDAHPTAITSTNPTATFTEVGPRISGTSGYADIWHSPDNFACTSTTTIKVVFSSATTTSGDVTIYDMSGMATSGALDTSVTCGAGTPPLCGTTGTQTGGFSSPLTLTSLTPSTSSGITILSGNVADNGVTSCNPTGYSDDQDNNDMYCHFIYSSNSIQNFSVATDQRQAAGAVGAWAVAMASFKAAPTGTLPSAGFGGTAGIGGKAGVGQ